MYAFSENQILLCSPLNDNFKSIKFSFRKGIDGRGGLWSLIDRYILSSTFVLIKIKTNQFLFEFNRYFLSIFFCTFHFLLIILYFNPCSFHWFTFFWSFHFLLTFSSVPIFPVPLWSSIITFSKIVLTSFVNCPTFSWSYFFLVFLFLRPFHFPLILPLSIIWPFKFSRKTVFLTALIF